MMMLAVKIVGLVSKSADCSVQVMDVYTTDTDDIMNCLIWGGWSLWQA